MNLPPHSLKYLQDSKFASTYQLDLEFDSDDHRLYSRIEWLTKTVVNKKIVHLGCVDHNLETLKKKINKNQWLHAQLDEVTKRCLGIDINEEGIDYLRAEMGYKDVKAENIVTEHSPSIAGDDWDYIILGEVVEHMDNPTEFLSAIHKHYQNNIKKIIITVPNAFALKNFKHAKKGQERINSDHRYWFTPFTACKLLTVSGYKVTSLRSCGGNKDKFRSFFKNVKLKKSPLLRNGLIIEADF